VALKIYLFVEYKKYLPGIINKLGNLEGFIRNFKVKEKKNVPMRRTL
jgi:hypothetical protein